MKSLTSKNNWLAFDKTWFAYHQNTLLWLLNAPLVKIWFRYVMRIREFDCPLKTRIDAVAPNFFAYNLVRKGDKYEVTKDFRTHYKFAKRIYFTFKPFWWALHYWDSLFADRFVPALSFGMDTLTAYPDPNPETATVDGYVLRTAAEAWATKTAGAGTDFDDTGTSDGFVRIVSTTANNWNILRRSIFLFDTSSLGAGSTISAAVMSLFGESKTDNLAITPNIDIYTSTPASNTALEAADYGNTGSTSQTGAAMSYASWSGASVYNDFTFSATGRGNVSKTGVSKFAARNANYDVANTPPTWSDSVSSNLGGSYADAAGTTQDPKLVVTYTIAAAAGGNFRRMLMGVG